jgi:hypothetical protein
VRSPPSRPARIRRSRVAPAPRRASTTQRSQPALRHSTKDATNLRGANRPSPRGAATPSGPGLEPARLPDDDDRVSFPQTPEVRKARADARSRARSATPRTSSILRDRDSAHAVQMAGGNRPRRARPRRVRAQRHGAIFRRAALRLRLHRKYAGWVQSYGSRCVRPPIIFGDVSRPRPMTVGWWSLCPVADGKPMKGMLTGPVTILNWSFVRDDQPRERPGLPPDRLRDPRRGGWIWKRPACARSSRSTKPRCARACRCAGASGSTISPGRSRASGITASGVADAHADPHPYVLLGVQRHHRARSARWMPTSSRSRRRGRRWSCSTPSSVLSLPERDRPRRLRHPLPARPGGAPR